MPTEVSKEDFSGELFSSQRYLLNGEKNGAAQGEMEVISVLVEDPAKEQAKIQQAAADQETGEQLQQQKQEQEHQNGEQQQQQKQGSNWSVPFFLGGIGMTYTSLASQVNSKAALLSPSATFRRMAAAREVVSLQTPSCNEEFSQEGDSQQQHGIRLRDGVNLPVVGEIRWKTMKLYALDWLRNPKNLALLAWILAVAVSGAILFMVMTGMLNAAIPKKGERDTWFEVNNQILNALFTLMCLYLHPQRFLHAYQLIRWNRSDVLSLRKVYCKHGTRKPHEWIHMVVVVLLLHMNCFSQYALCGLNWGYPRSRRPAIGVGVCLASAIGCAAAAGIYNTLSPLGRDYFEHEEEDEEMGLPASAGHSMLSRVSTRKRWNFLERRRSFAHRDGKLVERPEWQGGLFDCWEDPEVAVLSATCGFCVFGWNMDRLGFGNRFVHIATFLLICSAPYWIFLLAAGNIDNKYVRQGLGIAGIVLCIFGLLYGGFWRIRMRTTFGLPAQKWCCGQPNATDCTQWMFCCLCSLCQEVRTAGHYDIKDDKFYVKETQTQQGQQHNLSSSSSSSLPSSPVSRPSPLGREAPRMQAMSF